VSYIAHKNEFPFYYTFQNNKSQIEHNCSETLFFNLEITYTSVFLALYGSTEEDKTLKNYYIMYPVRPEMTSGRPWFEFRFNHDFLFQNYSSKFKFFPWQMVD
jgi:hypothetical protein